MLITVSASRSIEQPTVDVNLFAYNSAETVARAIDSVLRQTWTSVSLTVIDDGSNDGTADILAFYAARYPHVRLKRNRRNGGAIAAFQRAFWHGDADFVMPKSGDDVIAPDFIERTMGVLLATPDCAMCHAAGLVFTGLDDTRGGYPPEHRLCATGADPVARARHVMRRYTSSPSFWGVYRRAAVDQLSPIRYRAGWDHALLAELALLGEIRHVPEILYWRRDGGKPVSRLARAATRQARAGLPAEDPLGDPSWRTPLITTAFAHVETFATTALPLADRRALIVDIAPIFRARWLAPMQREAAAFRASLPDLIERIQEADFVEAQLAAAELARAMHASEALVPEIDMTPLRIELAALTASRATAA
ncbi:MAG: glycosyltransferase family A protein [Acetobacteraceae bacterium]